MYESVFRFLSWYQSYDLAGRSRRWRDNHDRGASAVEYALILAAIAAAVALLVATIGNFVYSRFFNACNALKNDPAVTCR
jgi:Flp pilus assembly pilin Flp